MYKILFAVAILAGSFTGVANADVYGKFTNKITYTSDEESSSTTSTTNYSQMNTGSLGEQRWSAGVFSGINSPKGEQKSSAEYGVIIGFEPMAAVGAGVEASTTRLNNNNDLRQTNVLLRGSYTIGGDIPVLRSSFIGAGVGPVFVSNRVRWAGAPIVGFDIPLSSKMHEVVSLGLEAKYLFVTNSDVANIFSSTLALKYWF